MRVTEEHAEQRLLCLRAHGQLYYVSRTAAPRILGGKLGNEKFRGGGGEGPAAFIHAKLGGLRACPHPRKNLEGKFGYLGLRSFLAQFQLITHQVQFKY